MWVKLTHFQFDSHAYTLLKWAKTKILSFSAANETHRQAHYAKEHIFIRKNMVRVYFTHDDTI